MKRISTLSMMLFLASAVTYTDAPAQSTGDDRHVVTIVLQPQARLDDTVIYLDQIAKLSGGPTALRQKLARMDVAEFKLNVNDVAVPAELVRFRILIAGVESAQFRLSGAKQAVVSESDDPIGTRKIVGAAAKTMRSKYPNSGAPK